MRFTATVAIRFVAILAFGLCVMTSAQAQGTPIVMKLSTATMGDAQHQWMKIFAAMVEKGSNGRIKPELYPASQLGSVPRAIEGTQFGSIQVFVGPPELLSGVNTRYEVLTAPGLLKDAAHAQRTLQDPEFNGAFLALGANKGLKGIALFISAPLVLNTRQPVKKLSDLEGRKIRVLASPLQMEQMKRLKATGVPVSLGEVIPALQQGTLDGVMSSGPVFTAMRFYDAAKYIYESEHAFLVSNAVVSKSWYDKLAPDLQKLILDSAQKAALEIYPWAVSFAGTQREAWLKAGGEIFTPTAAERAQLMSLMAPIGAEVTAAKPEEKTMFELLRKVAKRTEAAK